MNPSTDAAAIFAPIWRRKWLILIVGVLVAAGSYEHYKKQPTTFAVKTQLYLGAASEGQAVLNTTLGKTTKLGANAIANQAELINTSVGEVVKKRFRLEHNRVAAKGKAKAKAPASSEFIQISCEARTALAVSQVCNAYAQEYIRRHQANYERAVKSAISTVKLQIARIEKATAQAKSKSGRATNSSASTLQTAALNTKLNNLETDLGIKTVQQIAPARPAKAELLGPRPKKNGIFGFFIGIVLACIGAYVVSRFNRTLRSLADIEAVFETSILTALPAVKTPIIRRDGDVRPSKSLNEPLRRLYTTLKLEGRREGAFAPRSILFISADPGDGKSTVAAGLALVGRDANERSVVVEADFRRPVQARLLGMSVESSYGLADVLSGTTAASTALRPVSAGAGEQHAADAAGNVATIVSPAAGSAWVLLGSTEVANPPALLGRPEMAELIRSLGEDYDVVLVDAPPPLAVSDVMPLLSAVDGIVLIARIGHTRESSARRLVQLLERTPSAPIIGVVANAARENEMENYGLGSGRRRGGLPFGRKRR